MEFLRKKVLKCLRISKSVGIGILRPANLPRLITEVVDIGILQTEHIPLVITEDVLVDVGLGHNRPATLPLAIGEKELMLNGEVDIGLIPSTIPPITKLNVVYC